MKRFTISFATDSEGEEPGDDRGHGHGETFPALALPAGQVLSEDLTIKNSPVLFGCRTGICGTCVVEVVEGAEALTPPDEDEIEILDLYATGRPRTRLACQIDLQGDITLRAHCKPRWSGS